MTINMMDAPVTIDGRSSRRIIYIVALALIAFGVWASYAQINEVVRGNGRVAPRIQPQLVQNLEGGIVEDILVSEGDTVAVGQIIARMDPTSFQSAHQELLEQAAGLEIRLARLQAEREPGAIDALAPEYHEMAPSVAEAEEDLMRARATEFLRTLAAMEETIDLQQQELDVITPAAQNNALPQVELIEAKQSLADAKRAFNEFVDAFHSGRTGELSETLNQLRQIRQQLNVREDQLERTVLYSPVAGVVNRIMVPTIGGVVGPGEPIIEITPNDEQLIIEGQIAPRDVGFVYLGMPATAKLTAFDFAIYGTLTGTVSHISADTVIDEDSRDGERVYEVIIALDQQELTGPNDTVRIRPGMQATIELESGNKSILEYLVKPLFRATEAFSER